jgi:hypothetical protein
MPNELIVGAVQPPTGSAEKATDPKSAAFTAPQASGSTESPQLFVNPTLKFDSTLGLLVIEFRDQSGNVSTSIPSQRQLDAYRLHQQPLPGQKPATPHRTAPETPATTATPTTTVTPPTGSATPSSSTT